MRLVTRQSAAGSDPDGAIRLFGKRVQVAVVPCQPVAHVEVAPAGAFQHIHALFRPHPQPSRLVEIEKVNEPVASGPLNAPLDGHAARLEVNAVDSAPITIANPN